MALLLAWVSGCARAPQVPPPREVRVTPPRVTLACPDSPEGADLYLLPNRSPVRLVARSSPVVADSTEGVTIEDVRVTFSLAAVYPVRDSFSIQIYKSEEKDEYLWYPPEEDGVYRLVCHATQTVTAGENILLSGAEGREGRYSLGSPSEPLLIQVPASSGQLENWSLFGYPLGTYPDPTEKTVKAIVRNHAEAYRVPDWFYRVGPENRNLRISANFRLNEMDMDHEYWTPDYGTPYEFIALHPALLKKMEILLDRVRKTYGASARFEIMAGFRSPKYNLEVKREDPDFTQTSVFSMHMYGKAIDFIVDSDGDGRMDDLSGDGKIDLEDTKKVQDLADEIDQASAPGEGTILGGFGMYPRHDIKARELQTPYVHMDVRGYLNEQGSPSRWIIN